VESEFAKPAPRTGQKSAANPGEELSHLRHANALNAEILSSLRAAREHELHRSSEHAALIAAVSAQIRIQWTAVLEQGAASGRHGTEAECASVLIEDLAEYASACAGSLTLERQSVHLARFLRQLLQPLAALSGVNSMPPAIHVQECVPPWVVADARGLSKILTEMLLVARERGVRPVALSVRLNSDPVVDDALPGDAIVIAVESQMESTPRLSAAEPTTQRALRSALVEQLRELLGASIRQGADTAACQCSYLTLPLEACEDPVQASELERAANAAAWHAGAGQPAEASSEAGAGEPGTAEQGAIDFTYLDRQLGSLAQLVLVRTAPQFLALADERLTTLVVALEMQDLERMRDLAQAWKASSMSVGARVLANLLGLVEKQAAGGHLPGEGFIRQIKEALERLRPALAALNPASETRS
jgi:hypothetical protein